MSVRVVPPEPLIVRDDVLRALAEDVRDGDVTARRKLTDGTEVLQECGGIGKADLIGHRRHQPPRPTGAKSDARPGHEVGDGNGVGHDAPGTKEGVRRESAEGLSWLRLAPAQAFSWLRLPPAP